MPTAWFHVKLLIYDYFQFYYGLSILYILYIFKKGHKVQNTFLNETSLALEHFWPKGKKML